MLRRVMMGVNVAGATGAWNSADKSSSVTLSGSDKIAVKTTAGNEWASVRANLARSAGKLYFEFRHRNFSSSIDATLGIANSSMLLDGSGGGSGSGGFVGSGASGVSFGIYHRDGKKCTNNTFSAYDSGFGTSFDGTIGVAVDFTSGKMWLSKNNAWLQSGDPAAGTNEAHSGLSGSYYPACSHFNGDSYYETTIRMASADLAYSPPSGFSAWE